MLFKEAFREINDSGFFKKDAKTFWKNLELFEVNRNWKMPRGYKLDGQVIVPSNSKLKVQLIVKDKKEEVKVANTIWNPGSPAIRTETENFIAQAVKDRIIQAPHLKDLQNGVMTTDRLIGLYITIEQRRNNKNS